MQQLLYPALLSPLLALVACQHHDTPKRPEKAAGVAVQTTAVTTRDVELTVNAVGSVEAFERVPVTARVAGAVERIAFTEGDRVRRGQLLVEIEVARYVLAVNAAEAALQRARAGLEEAQAGVARRESDKARSLGIVPQEELQQWHTRVASLGAESRQAEVALAQAQLNLRDARVRAPEDGVIETREARTGQYVQVGSTLASLVRRNPLLLRFAVADVDAPRLHVGMAVHFSVRHQAKPFDATVIHVAGAADEASRMVRVTARVASERAALLRPGAFAEVIVPIEGAQAAPVVPQTAVRASEHGFLAYVVEDDAAHERRVRLGLRTADGHVEVREGLRPGEALVVRGAEALGDGARVRVMVADDSGHHAETTSP